MGEVYAGHRELYSQVYSSQNYRGDADGHPKQRDFSECGTQVVRSEKYPRPGKVQD